MSGAQGPVLIGRLHDGEVEEFALFLVLREVVVQNDVELGINEVKGLTGVLFEYIRDKLVVSFLKSATVCTS